MLTFSGSDIIKILDQVPVWRSLRELPKRVELLEKECSALRAEIEAMRTAPAIVPGEFCKACGHSALRKREDKAAQNRQLAAFGVREQIWVCEQCGDNEHRQVRNR